MTSVDETVPREALVERLAEAMFSADDEWNHGGGVTGTWDNYLARAVLPLVAAEVEAAVSVVRAERDEWQETAERELVHCEALGWRVKAAEFERDALREKVARVEAEADAMDAMADELPTEASGLRLGARSIRTALSDPTTPDQPEEQS